MMRRLLVRIVAIGLLLLYEADLRHVDDHDEDHRMLMEMWAWYAPNSEKLTTLMATFDKVGEIMALDGLRKFVWPNEANVRSSLLL